MVQAGWEKGFTLVELLIAMVFGLVVLGAAVGTFLIQNRHYTEQDQVVEMQESARNAMQMIVNDLLMAGYNPTGTADVGFVAGDTGPTAIRFRQDLDADGATTGSNEDVTYAFDSANGRITRKSTAADTATPLVENIDALAFTYVDADDAATTTPSEIRKVRIRLVVETRNQDRTQTLSTDVIPRNIGFQPAGGGTTVTETTTTTTTETSTSSTDSTSSSSSSSSSSTGSSPTDTSSTSSSSSTTAGSTTTTTAGGDATGPAIALISPPSGTAAKNTPIQVCGTVVDDTGVAGVQINWARFKSNGDPDGSGTVSMSVTSGSTYCGNIPSAANNQVVRYTVSATDTLGNVSTTIQYAYTAN